MELIYNCLFCEKCPFYDFEMSWCNFYKKRTWQLSDGKPTWCTVLEVTIKKD